MSRGLFGEDKGSGFTVCCFRFSVMGNGPDGAGPSDGGNPATRRSRLHRGRGMVLGLGFCVSCFPLRERWGRDWRDDLPPAPLFAGCFLE